MRERRDNFLSKGMQFVFKDSNYQTKIYGLEIQLLGIWILISNSFVQLNAKH